MPPVHRAVPGGFRLLCTSAIRSPLVWGWALISLGAPWVAQRVWAIPVRPISAHCPVPTPVPLLCPALAHPKLAGTIDYRQTRRVITAVLQTPQPLQQYFRHIPLANSSHNATHTSVLFPAGRGPAHYIALAGPAHGQLFLLHIVSHHGTRSDEGIVREGDRCDGGAVEPTKTPSPIRVGCLSTPS